MTWIRSGIGSVSNCFLRRWILLGLLGLAMAASYVHASLLSRKDKTVSLHPSQEVAVAAEADYMMDRIDALFAFSAPWEDQEAKDRRMASVRKNANGREILAVKFGPPEILQTETVDTATRVAIPIPNVTERTRATGEVREDQRVPDASNGCFGVLEKRETSGGPKWYLTDISPGVGLELREWLKLPRKRVADAPTIVLKKAIIVQILSADNTVVDQRILYFDK